MDLTHLSKRSEERLESIMTDCGTELKIRGRILMNQTDIGVMKNGGRNGARYAPEAIVNVLKKMAWHKNFEQKIVLHSFSNQEQELKDFTHAQDVLSADYEKILNANANGPLIQLGGGHDHIYPLLKALSTKYKKILCLNIDAHCDTRTDQVHHSGTPFRQASELLGDKLELWQIGVHNYANTVSTMSPLKKTQSTNFSAPLTNSTLQVIKEKLNNMDTSETALVFSLDADALASDVMEGVSAVNHAGLTQEQVTLLLEMVMSKNCPTFYGMYEYNPLYDNLSQKGARYLASLIYKILDY